MKKSQTFLYSCLAFICGVAARSFFAISYFYIFIILAAGAVVLGFTWGDKKWRVMGLVLIFLGLGILRCNPNLPFDAAQGRRMHPNATNTVNEFVTFVGVVVGEPDERIDNVKLKIKVKEIRGEKLEIQNQETKKLSLRRDSALLTTGGSVRGNKEILVTTSLYPGYQYGDELEISCKLQRPTMVEDFDYPRYLAMKGIYYVCYQPKIKLINHDRGNWVYAKILRLKNKLELIIEQGMPEPEAGIFSALLLNRQKNISPDLNDKFNLVGISHMMAISGSHITIISGIIMSFLIGLGFWRRQAFWLATIFLILYIIMIGAPASAARAGVMGFLVLSAMNLGRLNKSLNGLVFAAGLMLLINPLILRSDVGFQLSFLAVLGLIYFSSFFEKILKRVPENLGIRDSLVMTFSATITTLPLIAYQFHRVSIVAPLANVLILPTFPFILILGTAGMVSGLLWIGLAKILFVPTWLLLAYLVKVTEFFAGIKFAGVEIESVSVAAVAVIYMGVGVVIWRMRKIINN